MAAVNDKASSPDTTDIRPTKCCGYLPVCSPRCAFYDQVTRGRQVSDADRLEAAWEAIFGKWDGEEGVVYQGLNGSRRTIMAKLRRMLAALDALKETR